MSSMCPTFRYCSTPVFLPRLLHAMLRTFLYHLSSKTPVVFFSDVRWSMIHIHKLAALVAKLLDVFTKAMCRKCNILKNTK